MNGLSQEKISKPLRQLHGKSNNLELALCEELEEDAIKHWKDSK